MNQYYTTLLETLKTEPLIRKTVLTGEATGCEALFSQSKMVASLGSEGQAWEGEDLLVENLGSKIELVICGGGHVAKELYALATQLEMEISILDERKEFCNPTLYPKASLYCAPFGETFATSQPWIRPFFVLVTRGHGFDQFCLEKTLALPHAYIGMIGSKHKVAITLDNLEKKGIPQQALSTVHTPIGLPIGAVTAAEIAISIMAQIIGVYRKEENLVRLDPKLLRTIAERKGYILARVVKKSGSAPCDVGFQIAVFSDGTTQGTVGGGLVEAKAIAHAKEMLSSPALSDVVVEYGLDSSKAGSLGMICGGDVHILFQRR